jgi:putative ABC transport system substrate-binding protein
MLIRNGKPDPDGGVRAPTEACAVGKNVATSPDLCVWREFEAKEAAMYVGGAAETVDGVDAGRCGVKQPSGELPRADRGPRRKRAALAVAAFLLSVSGPAAAQDKPIEIGVLALGPRFIPDWHCGKTDHRAGVADPRHDTKPYYVLGLVAELDKLKYVEDRPENAGRPGRRFVLNFRTGNLQQVRGYAREFAQKRVDVIVGVATASVRIAQEETRGSSIPILMVGVSDPVREKFVQSLARPGGLITGASHQSVQGTSKRVELFKEMLPGLNRLITIRMPGYTPSEKSMADIRAVTDRLNIEVIDWIVKSRGELQAKLASVTPGSADGFMVLPDTLAIANLDLVIETSLAQRIPAFGMQDYMADWGAIAAYGPSAYQAGERTARYLDKISKGAKPGDIAVEPLDPTFVVNLKAAACLGITLPLEVLHQADRVIR